MDRTSAVSKRLKEYREIHGLTLSELSAKCGVVSQRSILCPDYIMDKIKALPSREGRLFRMHPDTIRKHVHAACKRAGVVDTTAHGLRHTNAAVMKTLGIDDRHAMARGGWSCESTYRKTYSYVFASKATEADTKINDYFSSLQITDEITDAEK